MIDLLQGDITAVEADALVNAANSRLAGGGGVDGAIHRAGGPSIMEECRRIGGCPTGSAVITRAGNLRARYVIHAVAPIYRGVPDDAELLRAAYVRSMELAAEHGVRSIAFPSLGTGAYGYPIEEASAIALRTVMDRVRNAQTRIDRILFVLFSERDFAVYRTTLKSLR